MTEQFFDKELAAREVPGIPGMMEFDIPVRGTTEAGLGEFPKGKNAAARLS
ncbi:dTDP-4-dehydrorhamnose 3,5-epimerase [Streptococcus sanguinis]|uniref:dTDP-4-dehydrorhamnose 3,5-epimerase n=1 Tax=Streptococcus sanguinis TaxID=1305 RepID=A0A7Y0YS04_STRSA|nr:dTDP-4-dehydrorhamnose 3,5-epimerase [Streptococcus sanguinis]